MKIKDNTTRIGKILVFFTVFLLCSPYSVIAQDTVRYRLSESMLPDSTLFRYELGSIAFTHSGAQTFLKFANMTPTTISSFFKTENFTVLSTSDSISFFRFASFDDKHFPQTIFTGDSGSAAWTTFINSIKSRYDDSAFYVKPSSTYFNTSSTVYYIASLYNASNNSLLLRLDTLACFLWSAGKLGYTCYPPSNDMHLQKLNNVGTNVSVYLTVDRVTALPSGSSFVDSVNTESSNYSATPHLIYADTLVYPADRHDPYVQPKYSSVSRITDGDGNTFIPAGDYYKRKVFVGNHTVQKFIFFSDAATSASLVIYDVNGRKIMEAENQIMSGINTLLTDTGKLPSGEYTVIVTAQGKILLRNSILIVN